MIWLLVPAYALADRFAGGGWPALDDKLPGRAAFWAAIACAALGWLAAGLWGLLAALAWLIYRTPAWAIFGGRIDPRGARQIAGTFLRHAIAIPGLVLAAYFAGQPLIASAWCGLCFAIGATVLGASGLPRSHNDLVELARGALYGLAVVAVGWRA